jgi:diadenosine tetraphosphate (Ap4A) HIT family hydrolase
MVDPLDDAAAAPLATRGRHRRAFPDTDWRADRVGAARRGENPTVLARMRTGWAVIGDTQHLPGYCVLLADTADVDHLLDLPRTAQIDFLSDMALLGEAVFHACNGLDPAFRRVNYEVLGNALHQLHAHVHARYAWEPERYRSGPVWRYPDELRESPENLLSDQHDGLRDAITLELERVMLDAYGSLPSSDGLL